MLHLNHVVHPKPLGDDIPGITSKCAATAPPPAPLTTNSTLLLCLSVGNRAWDCRLTATTRNVNHEGWSQTVSHCLLIFLIDDAIPPTSATQGVCLTEVACNWPNSYVRRYYRRYRDSLREHGNA